VSVSPTYSARINCVAQDISRSAWTVQVRRNWERHTLGSSRPARACQTYKTGDCSADPINSFSGTGNSQCVPGDNVRANRDCLVTSARSPRGSCAQIPGVPKAMKVSCDSPMVPMPTSAVTPGATFRAGIGMKVNVWHNEAFECTGEPMMKDVVITAESTCMPVPTQAGQQQLYMMVHCNEMGAISSPWEVSRAAPSPQTHE
jgi:hypothetical protein